MKNLVTLFLFILFIQVGKSQNASWSFFTENGEPFYLYINNQLQNRVPVSSIKIDGLILKNYLVKVEFKDITLGEIQEELKVKKEREIIWVVFQDKNAFTIDLYEKAKRGMYSVPTDVPTVADYNNYKGKVGCAEPVSDSQVAEMMAGFDDFTFGDQRMETMRSFMKNNCTTVAQLKKMMETLDFEDNKLNMAKFAYSYVFDRENYYLLHSLFEYPYSVTDLSNYIGK